MAIRVTMSFAQSLDGCIASANGESKWISGDATLILSQELRRENDAILVGAGTVLTDNPRLTCRISPQNTPLRVILDPSLRTPPHFNVLQEQDSAPTLVYHSCGTQPSSEQLATAAEFIQLSESGYGKHPALPAISPENPPTAAYKKNKDTSTATTGTHLDLHLLLEDLERRGINSLYVEGGASVIASFLAKGLVDELIVVSAPIILGNGIKAIGDIGIEKLQDALTPEDCNIEKMGKDVVWRMKLS